MSEDVSGEEMQVFTGGLELLVRQEAQVIIEQLAVNKELTLAQLEGLFPDARIAQYYVGQLAEQLGVIDRRGDTCQLNLERLETYVIELLDTVGSYQTWVEVAEALALVKE